MEVSTLLRIALFIGSWINAILITIVLIFVALYFSKKSGRRNTLFRSVVIALFINDIICTISGCATAWSLLVSEGETGEFKATVVWSVPVMIFSTNISAIIEQSFLIHRFRTISKNNVLSIFLMVPVLTHFVFYMIAGVAIAKDPNFRFAGNLTTTAATVATSVCTFIDVVIPIALVLQLRKMRTAFRSTNSLIQRFMIHTIAAGCITGIAGAAVPVLFQMRASVTMIWALAFGRLYSITVLVNLVMLQHTRVGDNNDGIHTDGDLDNSVALRDGIYGHRSAVIRVTDQRRGESSPTKGTGTLIVDDNTSSNPASALRLDLEPLPKGTL